jgi:hypothetical protein
MYESNKKTADKAMAIKGKAKRVAFKTDEKLVF